jgi:hypothetical protein
MPMLAPLVAFGAWLVIAGHSLVIWQSNKSAEGIPMQWGVDGKPTWYAPPAIAMAFLPILSGVILAFAYTKSASVKDRNARLITFALVCLAVHALFSWKIGALASKAGN